MSSPRILLLSTSYLPLIGGSELAIRHLTDRMTGYEFDLVTGRFGRGMPRSETVGRVNVHRAGGPWALLSFLLPKVLMPLAIASAALKLMRRHDYALVHCYQASQAGGAAWLIRLRRPKVPLVLTLQEGKLLDAQSWLVRRMRGFIIRAADTVTAISRHLINYARSRGARSTVLIPNGVDTAAFTPAAHEADAPVIVSVSRLVEKNGLEPLIRAMPAVVTAVPGAQLVLVGDGPLARHLKIITNNLKIADFVRFVGSVPFGLLPDILRRARVFARPSLSEGFGSAFLEAMAAGVPVLATARGGIPDFISDGRTGVFCDPENPDDIAAKLVRILTDPLLRDRLRTAGLQLAREYDWDRIAERMNRVYKETISGFPITAVE